MKTDLDRPVVLIAATATGTAGVLVFALLPIFVGQITEQFQLDDAQSGFTASAYFLVYALISLTAPVWVRRVNWRHTTLVACVTMILGLTTLLGAPDFQYAIVAMVITGAGAALLLPISLTLVSDMRHVERAYAITLSFEQLVPALLLLALSASLLGNYELSTTLYASLVTVVLCLFLSFGLPVGGNPKQGKDGDSGQARTLAIVSLIALAVSFAGFAGLWAFFERIAIDGGLGETFAARWIAVGLFMAALGPLIAAYVEDRYGRILPIFGATAITVLSLVFILGTVDAWAYALVLTVLPLAYYFSLSYLFSIIADADPSGSVSCLMSFALACGALAGPSLFGVLRGAGIELWLMGLALACGAAMAIWVQRQLDSLD